MMILKYISLRGILLRNISVFFIPIACDVDFKNMMEIFIQSGTNIMEFYVCSQPQLSSSCNVKHGDTNISILIFAQPLRQLSHSIDACLSRTLEDRVIGIYDENRIKITYYYHHRYDSCNPSEIQNKGVIDLVEKSDDDDEEEEEVSCSRI